MPGQKEGEPPLAQATGFHGPPVIDGNRAYLAYGPDVVILDISDISKPKLIGQFPILRRLRAALPLAMTF